jgi:two-component sensor histidine kinase/HAMP domain-containing protein
MALVIGLALLLSHKTMKNSLVEGKTTRQIMHSMNELNNFVRSYMLYQDDRPRLQFLVEHDLITKLIDTIRFHNTEEQLILESIRHNSGSMRDAFLKLVSNYESPALVTNAALAKEAEERLAGRILIKSRDVVSNAFRLESLIHDEIATTQRRINVLVFFLVLAITLPLTTALIRMMRSINTSLASLRKGTEVIAAGDLNHRISLSARDEIGELSRSFDLMTEQLRNTTVSKDDLSKEMEERKRAEEAIKASLREKEVLLKEIHHRVKNNMQVISSLVSLQADESQDAAMRDILRDVTHRVRSMAMVHEKLYQSVDLSRIEFAEYARSLLSYLWRAHGTAASGIRLALDLEPVSLSVNAAVPCGLILNELVGNALKHAFPGRAGGEVAVSLRGDPQGKVHLCVRDNGMGLPAEFDWSQATSLGLRLIQMLAGQIHAGVEVSGHKGTEFTITFEEPKT